MNNHHHNHHTTSNTLPSQAPHALQQHAHSLALPHPPPHPHALPYAPATAAAPSHMHHLPHAPPLALPVSAPPPKKRGRPPKASYALMQQQQQQLQQHHQQHYSQLHRHLNQLDPSASPAFAASPQLVSRVGRPPRHHNLQSALPIAHPTVALPDAPTIAAAPGPAFGTNLSQMPALAQSAQPPPVSARELASVAGIVVLNSAPTPWKWSAGMRRGDLAWMPIPDNTSPNIGSPSTTLWPVVVVTRWIPDPRAPRDSQLDVVESLCAATVPSDVLAHSSSHIQQRPFSFVCGASHTGVDLLESVARNALLTSNTNTTTSNQQLQNAAAGSDSENPPATHAAAASTIVVTSTTADPSIEGSASGIPSPASTSVSDVFTAESDNGANSSSLGNIFMNMPRERSSLLFALAQKRAKFLQIYKSLMSLRVPLQDPTGISAAKQSSFTYGADALSSLKVHYVVKPLPLDNLADIMDDSQSSVQVGCLHATDADLLPFSFLQPDCREEDVSWNVAALQALDIAGSWGCPEPNSAECFSLAPEEVGVWGDVLAAIDSPRLPTDLVILASWSGGRRSIPNSSIQYVRKTKPSLISSITISPNLSDDGGDGDDDDDDELSSISSSSEPGEQENNTLKRQFSSRPSIPTRIWGLQTDIRLAAELIERVRETSWIGNDNVLRSDALATQALRSLQQQQQQCVVQYAAVARVGCERVQIGDLVRLSGRSAGIGRGGFGRMNTRRALVIPDRSEMRMFVDRQRHAPPRMKRSRAAAFGADAVGPSASAAADVVLKISDDGTAVVEEVPRTAERNGRANASRDDDPASGSSSTSITPIAATAAAATAATTPATITTTAAATADTADSYPSAFAVVVPPTDGIDYLEVTNIAVLRPNLLQCSNPKMAKASLFLFGQIYQRIPPDERANRPVPLFFPTGEARTVNVTAGEVLGRAHAQFQNVNLVCQNVF
ncbi:hypothetical protein HDU82_005065, partial [Entophlyctis luteolus]